MGTDAKLLNMDRGRSVYIDREYNIKNSILEKNNLDMHISDQGVPCYMLHDAILEMRDIFHNTDDLHYKMYDNICEWLRQQLAHDYIKLINEHSEEY